MRIKLNQDWKSFKVGDEINSPDAVANVLISAGIAEQLEPPLRNVSIEKMQTLRSDKMIRSSKNKDNQNR